jgi:hypothetical protein
MKEEATSLFSATLLSVYPQIGVEQAVNVGMAFISFLDCCREADLDANYLIELVDKDCNTIEVTKSLNEDILTLNAVATCRGAKHICSLAGLNVDSIMDSAKEIYEENWWKN